MVNDGRSTTGYPSSSAMASGVFHGVGVAGPRDLDAEVGHALVEELAVLAALDDVHVAADELTPYFSSTPDLASSTAVFRPVWPPRVGKSASGRSFAMTFSTKAGVMGST